MWQLRQVRSCRLSCSLFTAQTPARLTSTDARRWITPGRRQWGFYGSNCIQSNVTGTGINLTDRVVCFRQAGHIELAERLVECQYELTDRLAFYLCGRRPGWSQRLFMSTEGLVPEGSLSVWLTETTADFIIFSLISVCQLHWNWQSFPHVNVSKLSGTGPKAWTRAADLHWCTGMA